MAVGRTELTVDNFTVDNGAISLQEVVYKSKK